MLCCLMCEEAGAYSVHCAHKFFAEYKGKQSDLLFLYWFKQVPEYFG